MDPLPASRRPSTTGGRVQNEVRRALPTQHAAQNTTSPPVEPPKFHALSCLKLDHSFTLTGERLLFRRPGRGLSGSPGRTAPTQRPRSEYLYVEANVGCLEQANVARDFAPRHPTTPFLGWIPVSV